MKITREEFKELIGIFKDIEKTSQQLQKYIVIDNIDNMLYPLEMLIHKALGFSEEDENFIGCLLFDKELPAEAEYVEEIDEWVATKWISTDDLDSVYDKYISKDHKEEK